MIFHVVIYSLYINVKGRFQELLETRTGNDFEIKRDKLSRNENRYKTMYASMDDVKIVFKNLRNDRLLDPQYVTYCQVSWKCEHPFVPLLGTHGAAETNL